MKIALNPNSPNKEKKPRTPDRGIETKADRQKERERDRER